MNAPFDPRVLRLYAIVDEDFLKGHGLVAAGQALLRGGATCLQLRAKKASGRRFYSWAKELRSLTRRYGVPLWINDRVDVALAVGADGVHVGEEDLPLPEVLSLMEGRGWVGFSPADLERARWAQEMGAHYLGVGPIFSTASKEDAGEAVGMEGLRRVVAAVTIPVVAIGGLDHRHGREVLQQGAAGAAFISALLGSSDIEGATRVMKEAMNR
ncbi:MAG: thiamine phosphate synthase [Bacillota bacterium]|nr:thiamine phosphate synthase [Bacillota bacterium]